ncbi:uncharacterized protein LOC105180344 [Sesamum indicum]|uniref:Uncharacterized protein LOC105180344 n=1 Tax=Sesamum indicum TaxID=4182 RepID=A0A6I9UT27_SESIN|nr:uncharacterized protein LOC105180344 [Sesamum indicum]
MYHIIVQNNKEKLDKRVKKLPLQQDVVPLTQIIESIKIQPRDKLSLQDRLGGWILQKRKRNASNTSDKYYIHDKVTQNFRSLKEVATFILFSCRRNDLVLAQIKDGTGSNIRNVHVVSEVEKKIEGIPSEPGNGKQNQMDDEQWEIFACALNNPIINL